MTFRLMTVVLIQIFASNYDTKSRNAKYYWLFMKEGIVSQSQMPDRKIFIDLKK